MSRRGMTVLEMSIALLILTVALGGVLQLVSTAAKQRRTGEERRLALQELANQAERVAILPWDELTEAKLATLKPSAECEAANPTATIAATLAEDDGPPAAKRIRIEVAWTNAVGQQVDPLGVTLWRYAPAEEAQP
jgi:prepilin-type N-terminal cleavage/methylation domain-containing protein